MKRLLPLLFLLGALFPQPVAAASRVGQHIHVEILNHPVDTYTIPRAPYTFQVTIRLHDNTGRVTSFRVSDYSTVKKTQSVSLGPCSDCSVSFPFTVDFSSWAAGEHELRWTANIPSNGEGKRQFTTSRSYVRVGGSTNLHGRPDSWHAGGGGWYSGAEYAIAVQLSPDTAIRPGGVTSWRVQSNANWGCLYANPDFHHGSHGTQIGSCWSGTGSVSRTIPASLPVGSKLVQLAEDPSDRHIGVFEQRLGTGAARNTVFYGWQDWWSSSGLVLP